MKQTKPKQLDFLDALDKHSVLSQKHNRSLLLSIRNFKFLQTQIQTTKSYFSSVSPQYLPLQDAISALDRAVTYLYAILSCYLKDSKEYRDQTLKNIRLQLDQTSVDPSGDLVTPQQLLSNFSFCRSFSHNALSNILQHNWENPITESLLNISDRYDAELIELQQSLHSYKTTNHETKKKRN